jgi:hypothetical protein
MALLAGRREIAEIARFATTLTQPQRRRGGFIGRELIQDVGGIAFQISFAARLHFPLAQAGYGFEWI